MLFILAPIISYSQEREVFGRILDAENQKPIYGANVIVFESTQGTTTNAQGFFKFSVPADKKSLVVSHIGYQTSSIEIPADNKFLLKLEKDFQILSTLHLQYFDENDTTKENNEPEPPRLALNKNETDAKYKGGWKSFYRAIAGIMRTDSVQKTLQKSIFHLKFSVEVDGSTRFISLSPENTAGLNLLLAKSDGFKWESASQNNKNVTQYFDLPIDNLEEVFTVIEETAHPVGGMAAFYNFIAKEMQYPKYAKKKRLEGKVFIQFVINKDGALADIKVIKGLGMGCDEEAIRLVSISPKWNPGTQRGKPVKQRYTLPIIFKLN